MRGYYYGDYYCKDGDMKFFNRCGTDDRKPNSGCDNEVMDRDQVRRISILRKVELLLSCQCGVALGTEPLCVARAAHNGSQLKPGAGLRDRKNRERNVVQCSASQLKRPVR